MHVRKGIPANYIFVHTNYCGMKVLLMETSSDEIVRFSAFQQSLESCEGEEHQAEQLLAGLEEDWVDLNNSAVVLQKTALSGRKDDSVHHQ